MLAIHGNEEFVDGAKVKGKKVKGLFVRSFVRAFVCACVRVV